MWYWSSIKWHALCLERETRAPKNNSNAQILVLSQTIRTRSFVGIWGALRLFSIWTGCDLGRCRYLHWVLPCWDPILEKHGHRYSTVSKAWPELVLLKIFILSKAVCKMVDSRFLACHKNPNFDAAINDFCACAFSRSELRLGQENFTWVKTLAKTPSMRLRNWKLFNSSTPVLFTTARFRRCFLWHQADFPSFFPWPEFTV